jgi:hypothetical protein
MIWRKTSRHDAYASALTPLERAPERIDNRRKLLRIIGRAHGK